MRLNDWIMYRCESAQCSNAGHDLRVDSGIEFPSCFICGKLLSVIDSDTTPTMKAIEDDPDPDPSDKVTVYTGPLKNLYECDLRDRATFKVCEPWPEDGEGEDADPEWPEGDDDKEDDVNEWMRMRDGIDKAEISLKGFCQEMGANVTESKIAVICQDLQNLVYSYCGMGD